MEEFKTIEELFEYICNLNYRAGRGGLDLPVEENMKALDGITLMKIVKEVEDKSMKAGINDVE